MEIEQIYASEYKGYTKEVKYWTKAYYDILNQEDGFKLEWKEFDQSVEKSFTGTLFSDELEDPIVFGAFIDKALVGFVEGSMESWHNLFRISFFYVEAQHRHFGIGDQLIQRICDYAQIHTEARALILDTESCNTQAITFYKKHKFTIVGLNTMDYTNEDIEEREVNLVFGKKITRLPFQNSTESTHAIIRKP